MSVIGHHASREIVECLAASNCDDGAGPVDLASRMWERNPHLPSFLLMQYPNIDRDWLGCPMS